MVRWGFWKNRTHNLARMSLGDLVFAFFTYYAVLVYLGFAGISLWLAARWYEAWQPLAISAVVAALVYPLAWYLFHRFVLHSQFLYRSPLTARAWKRIHFDHHQDPHNLVVLQQRGPFDFDAELRLLKERKIDVIVSRNSGGSASYPKIEAARVLRLPVIMISRPAKPAGYIVRTAAEAMAWLGHERPAPSLRGV